MRCAAVATVLLAVAVAGCSDSEPPAAAPEAPAQPARPFTAERPFSAGSPWNTRVEDAPVDPRSDRLIRLARERVGVVESRGGGLVRLERRRLDDPLVVNTRSWTVPVVRSEDGVPTRLTCRQIAQPETCGDGRFVDTLLVPRDVDPLPQYDGWFSILDRRSGYAYDLWRARRAADGRSISYQFMRRWQLHGPGFLHPGQPSARGSGLPLFAGLITPQALAAGAIHHALAISVPGPAQQRYVQPASTTDGGGRVTSLPEGARIRLRPGVRIGGRASGNRRAAAIITRALREHGAIVVDRARVPTLYAQQNARWSRRTGRRGAPLLTGKELQALRLSDFEVVRMPPVRDWPPSGAGEPPAGLEGVAPQPTMAQERAR